MPISWQDAPDATQEYMFCELIHGLAGYVDQRYATIPPYSR